MKMQRASRKCTRARISAVGGLLVLAQISGAAAWVAPTNGVSTDAYDQYFRLRDVKIEMFDEVPGEADSVHLVKQSSQTVAVLEDGTLPPLPPLDPGASSTGYDPADPLPGVTPPALPGGGLVELLPTLVNIGEKVWTVVKDNRPVVESADAFATALPAGVRTAMELSGWAPPKARVCKVSYRNGFGMEVVHFDYRFTYQYGGMQGGKGRYLARVSLMPSNLRVMWGFKFKSHIEVAQPIAIGTPESPVAALQLDVKWQLETFLVNITQSQSYFIQGDGRFQVVQ